MREIIQHLYAHHGMQNTDAYLAADDGVQRENKKRGERSTQEDGREREERLTQKDEREQGKWLTGESKGNV